MIMEKNFNEFQIAMGAILEIWDPNVKSRI